MIDIFIIIGVIVSLFFVTFFIPFMIHISSERGLPSEEDDFFVIFILAWIIAVLIAAVTLCSCFSMQKELDKYENQVELEEKSDEHKL